MTEFEQAAIAQLTAIAEGQRHIYRALQKLVEAQSASQPQQHYQRSLAEWASFDWSTIGAQIVETDSDGVAVVEASGKRFVRRSAANKFEPAVWYSRAIGKDAEGNVSYERLATFKAIAGADPLPAKTKQALR